MENLHTLFCKGTQPYQSLIKATLAHLSHSPLHLRLQYTHLPPKYWGASKKTGGGSGLLQEEEWTTRIWKQEDNKECAGFPSKYSMPPALLLPCTPCSTRITLKILFDL